MTAAHTITARTVPLSKLWLEAKGWINPREFTGLDSDDITSMGASIKTKGIVEPPKVARILINGDVHDLVIDGQRRVLGAREVLAKDAPIPVVDLVDEVSAQGLPPQDHLRGLIHRFVQAYGEAQNEHRVLTEDLKFLDDEHRERMVEVERQLVGRFADAVAAVRPELRGAHLHKPLTMLLFGMINWTFTWLRSEGPLTYEDMAQVVSEIFLRGVTETATAQQHAA